MKREGNVERLLAHCLGLTSIDELEEVPAQVYDRAIDLGLDACLYRVAIDRGVHVPAFARAYWFEHIADTISRREAIKEIWAHAGERFELILLKGENFAARYFGDSYARRSSDIDILVRPKDVLGFGLALEEIGYATVDTESPEPWLYNQWVFAHREHGRVIEVHWSLASPDFPSPHVEELFSRSIQVSFGGARVTALGDADALVHMALHFHHHVGFLKGLFDVAAWLDWCQDHRTLDDATRIAGALGLGGVLAWPIAALPGRTPDDVCIGRVAAAAGRASSAAASGSFVRGKEIAGAHFLASKTREVLQVEVASWRLLGALMLDRWEDRLRAVIRITLRTPSMIAASEGRGTPNMADWIAWMKRPWTLALRGILEVQKQKK